MSTPHIYQLPPQPKRKKPAPQDEADGEEPTTEAGETNADNKSQSKTLKAVNDPQPNLAYLSRDHIAQYKLAGLPLSSPRPPAPFPVASADYIPRGQSVREEAKARAKQLDPPIDKWPESKVDNNNAIAARERHLAVINGMVHRCLQSGDYERASRAWGLLLRAMPKGTDVRKYGRWGIGAEILLRRKMKSNTWEREGSVDTDYTHSTMDIDHESEYADSETDEAEHYIPEINLEAVKKYYQRLIVRHPPRKNMPVGFNPDYVPPNFHSALFNVWIYQITQQSRKARNRISDTDEFGKTLIRQRELGSARELAEQFDSVVQNDPWDKEYELLKLRGMVSQWIADLVPRETGDEVEDDADDDAMEVDETEAQSEEQSDESAIEKDSPSNHDNGNNDDGNSSEDDSSDEDTRKTEAKSNKQDPDFDADTTSQLTDDDEDEDAAEDDDDDDEFLSDEIAMQVLTPRQRELRIADKFFKLASRFEPPPLYKVREGGFFMEYPSVRRR